MGTSIFLDESGDLGWEFRYGFGKGGSSRYFTLAAIIVADEQVPRLERIAASLYKRRKRPAKNELKSTHLATGERIQIASQMAALCRARKGIRVRSMTVRKQNCFDAFKRHPNGLYNYMAKLLLLEEMARHQIVHFIPDARSIKTELKHTLDDYLKTELAAMNAKTRLETTPWESQTCKALQMTDYLCSIVWSHYEFQTSTAFPEIRPVLTCKELFFER